jgi:prepilin-type N-terminal cleavage/methylation domain-containing protein
LGVLDQRITKKLSLFHGEEEFMHRSIPQKGFTLIELLIVIAIILILIAIALPNFLEAQIRAKTTRVEGDLRGLATALESYFTDFNQFPPDGDDLYPFNPANFDVLARMSVLTTPVQYVTALPLDPFHAERAGFSGEELLFPGPPPFPYSYNTTGSYYGGQGQPPNGGKADNYGITSLGPNMRFDSVEEQAALLYSPTNGTKSRGDILRLGGRRIGSSGS